MSERLKIPVRRVIGAAGKVKEVKVQVGVGPTAPAADARTGIAVARVRRNPARTS